MSAGEAKFYSEKVMGAGAKPERGASVGVGVLP
jgi:hypothetical protein